jgi:predicted outer membrane repeat protein
MLKAVRMTALMLMVALVLPLVFSPITTTKVEAICSANTIYVDAARPNDSGDGLSWATAKKYIQSGIGAACKPGTVYVAAGVYDQPAGNAYEIVWLDDNLTLIGAGALTTIIDGRDLYRGISITSHPGQVNKIAGFTIRNGRGPNYHSSLLPTFTAYGAGTGISLPYIRPWLFNGSRDLPDGGGIFITDEHRVTIEDCAIINNKGQNGGGIYNSGQLTMDRCTVSNNSAYGQGGGIYMNWSGPPAATLQLINCTISGNTAEGSYGGGIYCGTQMFLLNSTIVGNSITATASKGGGFANTGTAAFKNCIVANNIAMEHTNDNGAFWSGGTVISQGNNIDSQNSCGFNQPTDQINTNPLLGPLQNNGGPTSTHAITASSPAYNRGTINGSPMTDQRGVTRPQFGVCDIGAFELMQALTITSCNPNQGLQGQCPMTVVITGANLTGATTVSFGAGITVNSLVVNSATQITAIICIATGAGPRDVSVTTPFGYGTLMGGFTVITGLVGTGPQSSAGGGTQGTYTNSPPVALPTIKVQSASLSAKAVTPGTPVTVTADLTNKSAVNGNKKVTLYVNGQVETAQGVTVNSGSSSQLTFNVSRGEPGTYAVYVDGVPAGSFKVEMVTESDGILILSAALVAIAFLLGMVMLWRRQRTG